MALADYISDNFATIKSQLNWTDSVELPVIVTKALEMYGVANDSLAVDLVKYHALGDVAVWRRALNDIALDYNFSADGASFSRSQAVAAIRQNLAEAENKAIAYMPAYQMVVHQNDINPDWST